MALELRWMGRVGACALVCTLVWQGIARAEDGKSIFDDNFTPTTRPASPTPTPAPLPSANPSPKLNPEPPAITPPADPSLTPAPGASITPPADRTVPPPAAPGDAPVPAKVVPPDAAARAKLLKQVKQIYQNEYNQKTIAGRKALAGQLITEADKIKSNLDARFVLLQEAQWMAVSAGDVAGCRKAIEGIDHSFTLDTTPMVVDALARLTGADDNAVAAWAVEMIQQHLSQEDYAGARKILHQAAARILRSSDPAVREALKSSENLLAEFDRARAAIDKLKSDPADPAANYTAGRFFCFFRHEWARGLPMLARGTDLKLRDLARGDLVNPAAAPARYALAGKWWDLGQDRAHEFMQSHLRDRASFWYRQALPELGGLEKTMAEKRLADAPPAGAAADVVSGSPNLLKEMTATGSVSSQPDGTFKIPGDGGKLSFPKLIAVPFRADIVIRLLGDTSAAKFAYASGHLRFNSGNSPSTLQHWDPADPTKLSLVPGKGSLSADSDIRISWIVTETQCKIHVNGDERGAFPGDHKDLVGKFVIDSGDPGMIVKAIAITPLAPGGGVK